MTADPKFAPEFYITGGTVRPGSESYIVRQADEELFQALQSGEFCYVLTTRQMGKSSLMARTADRLAEAGFRSAQVDLTLIGADTESITSSQWYFGVAYRILRELKIDAPLAEWWNEHGSMSDVQRFTEFLEDLVLKQCADQIVIFVDEIDSTIGLSFSDDFFAAIRACYNFRPRNHSFRRLSFVLLGVATPAQLISNPARTPFNVGRGIELTDFTEDEASVLARGFKSQDRGEELLKRVLHWTGGQPYLTQALCQAVAKAKEEADGTALDGTALVDDLVREKFFSTMASQEERNLKFVRGRLRQGYSNLRMLLSLYLRVLRGGAVRDQPASPLYASLKLAGVVKTNHEGFLRVRNRIYEHVFDRQWVRREMPANIPRMVTAAVVGLVILIVAFGYFHLERGATPYLQTLRSVPSDDEIAYTAYRSLRTNFLYRNQAALEFARFWTGREDRDRALLTFLSGLNERDNVVYRQYAADMIGQDYPGLLNTVRFGDQVKAVAFSPDGKEVLTGDSKGTAQLWRTDTGEPIGAPMMHEARVVAGALSPDGKAIATGGWDNTVRLWDAQTGRPIVLGNAPIVLKHDGTVLVLAWSPNGNVIATGGWDTARLWDVKTGKPIGVPMKFEDEVSALAFRSDGKVLATAAGNIARLWQVDNGEPTGHPMKHEEAINDIVFSPDDRLFATASHDGSAQLWEADTGKPIRQPMKHKQGILTVLFSPDSRLVATGSQDGTVRLWRTDSGVSQGAPLRHLNSVFSLAFSVDGKMLLTGSADNHARLWNVETGALVRSPLHENGNVTLVKFGSDGKTVLTASDGGTARLWRIDAGAPLEPSVDHWTRNHGNDEWSSLSVDGKTLATGVNGKARLWRAETDEPIGSVLPQSGKVETADISPDGKLFATGSDDGTVRLWRADTAEPVGSPMHHEDSVFEVRFDLEGRVLMTGSKDGTARLWNTATGSPMGPPLKHGADVLSIDVNMRKHIAITGGRDGTAQLWQTDTSKQLRSFREEGEVSSVALSPDGHFAVTCNNAGAANVWRTDNGSRITSWRFKGWEGSAFFDWDGKTIAFLTPIWYFIRSWDGHSFQLTGVGMWRVFDYEDVNLPLHTTHWELRRNDGNGRGFLAVPIGKPVSAPIQGSPRALLDDWERRVALTFDSQGRIVPKYSPPVPPAPEGESADTNKAPRSKH